ncbi:MAG TPA: glycoside hydrolase family 38 C-terminal domain-containing protein, partial [Candidatus Cloacimonadota bacterium]|nr:glycoside hydrolase family 38 C-terminal domain-containing protein [Candidatus Cloacimonadota bacterium]
GGSEVLAHQLPTNDYNFSNNPSAFRQTEARFAQAEIAESYLNLFGIGDGGGGPTRNHIEYGLRQRDLEGSSRFIFSKAEDFFAEYALIPAHILPRCYTELYLEFHRGTYTTQAVMKQDNFFSERLLHAAEWMAALANLHSGKHEYPQQLHLIWKDTLLLQFHDILPGSSITKVYEDAHAVSSANHARLRAFIQEQAAAEPTPESYTIFNPSPTPVDQWLSFPIRYREAAAVLNHCEISQVLHDDDAMQILVHMEPYSKARLDFMAELSPMLQEREEILPCSGVYHLKSNTLNVKVSNTGSIISIKSEGQEFLSSESNLLQLWEDEPNNWGAWDINHFYKETTPQSVEHAEVVEAFRIGDYHRIVHKLKIGQSRITQIME